jgi:hypothetical protein
MSLGAMTGKLKTKMPDVDLILRWAFLFASPLRQRSTQQNIKRA